MISERQSGTIPEAVSRLGSETLGRSVLHYDTVASTQDALMDKTGSVPDGTVLVALTQTRGRGRLGRVWASPPGTLTFSVLLRPRIPADLAGMVMLASSISLHRAINKYAPGRAAIKWPNDILIDDAKVAGIILDTSLQDTVQWMVVGVGVNVSSDPSTVASMLGAGSPPGRVGSLADCDPTISGLDLLSTFLADLDSHYSRINGGEHRYLIPLYRERCSTIGRMILSDGAAGRASGIDLDGALLVETAHGQRRVLSGDVTVHR